MNNINGFTLIEVMIVMCLIAITISMIEIKSPDSVDRQLKKAAEKLQWYIIAVQNQAVITGKTQLFIIDKNEHQYTYTHFKQSTSKTKLDWKKPGKQIQFFKINLTNNPLIKTPPTYSNQTTLYFSPLGESEKFNIEIQLENKSWWIFSDEYGEIKNNDQLSTEGIHAF